MVSTKLIYSISRYWRCYFLILVASVLSFLLIYISEHDPNLEHYFPYFQLGNGGGGGAKLDGHAAAAQLAGLIEPNNLDHEFLTANARLCLRPANKNPHNNNNNNNGPTGDADPIRLLSNDGQLDDNFELNFVVLSVGQAHHFKHRLAARFTWAKRLPATNSRLVFVVGKPAMSSSAEDKSRLSAEMTTYNDIVQIDVADNANETSTKTLIALRWALTYCAFAKHVLVLGDDAAVLNHRSLATLARRLATHDTALAGHCNYTDQRLPLALKHLSKTTATTTTTTTPPTNQSSAKTANKTEVVVDVSYNGRFCSSLGWSVTMGGARRLWMAALRTPFIVKQSAAYLTGYLPFRAGLELRTAFAVLDTVPGKSTCVHVLEQRPEVAVCAENFTVAARYSAHIAAWNSAGQSQLGIMIKH